MAISKRYQVYVCGSYGDLKEERQLLFKLLLGIDCIPAAPEFVGDMGLHGEATWPMMQHQIDSSDYVLILQGGRYGTLTRSGISFAHREYTYAKAKGKPILCLLQDAHSPLPAAKTETSAEGQARLKLFLSELAPLPSLRWGSLDVLSDLLIHQFPDFIRQNPSVGWVRDTGGDASNSLLDENRQLKIQLGELRTQEKLTQDSAASMAIKKLESSREHSFSCNLYVQGNCKLLPLKANINWIDIFLAFSESMQKAQSEDQIKRNLADFLSAHYLAKITKRHSEAHAINEFQFSETSLRMIRLELRQIGLVRKVEQSDKHRTVWELSPLGKRVRSHSVAKMSH